MFAAFSIIPFLSSYLVKNVGLTEHDLPYVYLVGGMFTLITSRFVGKLADRFGKQRIFTLMASLSTLPILILTHLPQVSVVAAILTTTFFTVSVSGRAIPAMSLITSSVETRYRGSFMSFTTAIQQMASSFASLIGGLILQDSASGQLLHYHWVGYLAVLATIVSIVFANRLHMNGT